MTHRICLILVAIGLLTAVVAAADMPVETPTPTDPECLQVLDIIMVSSNRVRIGSNTFTFAEAADRLTREVDNVDALALYIPADTLSSREDEPSRWTRLARTGIPLLLVEQDEGYALRRQTEGQEVRSVSLDSTQAAALRRLLYGTSANTTSARPPVLRATLSDTENGAPELRSLDLGLFGERVWLMHTQDDPDAPDGSIGIQFRRAW